MSEQMDARRRRASFRAHHRGTKEMDWLLGKFVDVKLADMADADLDLFEQLIQLPDPDLQGWILDPTTLHDRAFANLIAQLHTFHRLDHPGA